MKKFILPVWLATITVIFYIGGTVANKSFQPFAWANDYREIIAGVWIAVMLLTSAMYTINSEMDKTTKK